MLGPLEVHGDDGAIPLGAPKQRTVLALLLARANTFVAIDELIEELWGDRPPPSSLANVRLYAANLRRLLVRSGAGPTVRKQGPGYELRVAASAFDLALFRDLTDLGRQAFTRQALGFAEQRLDQATQLWRGCAAADVPAGRVLAGWRSTLEEERLTALEIYGKVLLGLGAYDRATRVVQNVLSVQPLREHAHALLMIARYQAGDCAGALTAYDSARRSLVDQLGIEPGPELARAHRAILNRDPIRLSPAGRPPGVTFA